MLETLPDHKSGISSSFLLRVHHTCFSTPPNLNLVTCTFSKSYILFEITRAWSCDSHEQRDRVTLFSSFHSSEGEWVWKVWKKFNIATLSGVAHPDTQHFPHAVVNLVLFLVLSGFFFLFVPISAFCSALAPLLAFHVYVTVNYYWKVRLSGSKVSCS